MSTPGNDIVVLQATSLPIMGAGAGNDRYVLDPLNLTAGQSITVTDSQGTNTLQLVGGLQITSAQVAANALKLTLSNGATVTVLGASTFQFQLAGNGLNGTGGVIQSFSAFVTQSLGSTVPTGNQFVNTGPVTVNNDGSTSIGGGAVNVAPVITAAGTLAATEDVAATLAVSVTDANTADTVTVTATAANGNVSISNGVLTYQGKQDFNGTDTITITANDGTVTTTKTVAVTVAAVNDAPVVTAPATLAATEDTAATFSVSATDVDSASVTLTATAANGTVSINNGVVTYQGKQNFNGTDTITITANDGVTTSSKAVAVTVAAVNDAPVAAAGTATVAEGATFAGQLTATDVDAGDTHTFALNAPVAGLTLNANGSYSFNAAQNPTASALKYTDAPATIAATYTVTDAAGATSQSTLTLTVTPTPLTFALSKAGTAVAEGATQTFTITASEAVATATDVVFTLVPGNGTAANAGTSTANTTDFGFTAFNPVTKTIAAGQTTTTVDVTPLVDKLAELPEGFKVVATVGSQSYELSSSILDGAPPAATYSVTPSTSGINEGATVVFAIATTDVTPGTTVYWQLSGVSAADVGGNTLTGSTVVGNDGTANVSISALADSLTEGVESLTLTLFSDAARTVQVAASSAVTVADTSTSDLVLIVGPEVKEGSNLGNNTFLATNNTLGAGDKLTGGALVDTLKVSTDGAADVNFSGFTMSAIERVEVTSDNAGKTTAFDLSGATGLTTVVSNNSSAASAFNQLANLVDAEVNNLTGAANNVTIMYQDAVLAGGSDSMKLTTSNTNANVVTIGRAGVPNGGLENLTVEALGAGSTINRINSDITKLTVVGSQNLTVTTALNATANNIQAGTFSGNLNLTMGAVAGDATINSGFGSDVLDASNVAGNVNATLGSGTNVLNMGTGLTATDSITGGTGADTVRVTTAATSTTDANLSGVETILLDGGSTNLNLVGQTEGFTIDMSVLGDHQVVSGGGNDTLLGGNNVTAADAINGGTGSDTLSVTGNTTHGTDANLVGVEQVRYDNTGAAITVNLTGQTEGFNVTLSTAGNGDTWTHTGNTAGADNVTGNAGANTVNLGNANNGGALTHTVDGAGGTDTVNLDAAGQVQITNVEVVNVLGASVVTVANDNTTNVTVNDDVGANDDVITLAGGNDTVNAGDGNDNINVGSGNNRVVISSANLSAGDTVAAGAGLDTLEISAGVAVVDAQFAGVSGFETLQLDGTTNAVLGSLAKAEGFTLVTGVNGAGALNNNVTVVQQATAWTLNVNGGEDWVDVDNNGVDDRGGAATNVDFDSVTIDGTGGNKGAVTLNLTDVESVNAAGANSGVTLNVLESASPARFENVDITGSAFADNINGGSGNDTINGGDGKDTMAGGAGDDVYVLSVNQYNADKDSIVEQANGGTDTVRLQEGVNANVLINDAGFNDRFVNNNIEALDLIGAGGGTTFRLGTAADGSSLGGLGAYVSQTGIQSITASTNATLDLLFNAQLVTPITVNGGAGADKVNGAAMTTKLTYNDEGGLAANDTVTSGSGNDVITLKDGNNVVSTFGGDDIVTLGTGADSVDAGSGNDTIIGGANTTDADQILGGTDIDTLSLKGTTFLTASNLVSGVETIALGSQGVGVGNNGFDYGIRLDNDNAATGSAVLTVDGSALLADADTVTGGNQSEQMEIIAQDVTNFSVNIIGGGGDDGLAGGEMADTLTGGGGSDLIVGNGGADTIILTEASAARDTVQITSVADGVDTITGFDASSDSDANTGGVQTANQDVLLLNYGLVQGNLSIQAGSQGGNFSANSVVTIAAAIPGGCDTAVKVATFLQTSNLGVLQSVQDVRKVFVMHDGTDTYVWAYDNDDNANVNATEFTLLAKLNGVTGLGADNIQMQSLFTQFDDVESLNPGSYDGKAGVDEVTLLGAGTYNLTAIESVVSTGNQTDLILQSVPTTLNLTNGSDTIAFQNGITNITALNGGAATTAERLDLGNAQNLTMTLAQHNAFTNGITDVAVSNNTITLSTAGTLSGDSDVETYVLADAAGNVFTLGANGQNVTGAGSVADEVRTGSITTVTGTLALGNTGTDLLVVETDATNISMATTTEVEQINLSTNVDVTMTTAQHAKLSAVNAAGDNTVTFTDKANSITGNTGVESFVLANVIGNDFTLSALGQDVTGSAANGDVIRGNDLVTKSSTLVGGASASDQLTLTNDTSPDDLDNVSGFETITIVNTDASSYTTVNGLVAAGATLTVTQTGGQSLTWNGALESDGKFNITTSGGDDVITLGANGLTDTVSSGAGKDQITLGTGDDSVDAGAGDDTIQGGANVGANDTLIGGADDTDDVLNITGSATVTTEGNFQTIEIVNWTDALTVDTVTFAGQSESLVFNIGSDAGADLVFVPGVIDTIILGSGDDTIVGGQNLESNGAGFFDVLDGGTGTNELRIGASFVNQGNQHDDQLKNIQNLVVTSNAGITVDLSKQTDNFTVTGGDGNDTVVLGIGASTYDLDAGKGNDTVTGGSSVTVGDTLVGGDGTDVLTLVDDDAVNTNELNNVSGFETITIASTGVSDYITTDGLVASGATLTVTQTTAFALLWNASAELDGAFKVSTSSGNDTIDGGNGNDTIDSGTGNDDLAGGGGADVFTFDTAADLDSSDTVDGGVGSDTLNVTDTLVAGDLNNVSNFETVNLTISGGSALTLVGDGVLTGTSVAVNVSGSGAFALNLSAENSSNIALSLTGSTGADTVTWDGTIANITTNLLTVTGLGLGDSINTAQAGVAAYLFDFAAGSFNALTFAADVNSARAALGGAYTAAAGDVYLARFGGVNGDVYAVVDNGVNGVTDDDVVVQLVGYTRPLSETIFS